MRALISFLLLTLPLASHAQSPNALSYNVNVQESIIDASGIKYRKIEYKGDIFYMRLLEHEADAGKVELACADEQIKNAPNQIVISTQITKRSSLFIEGLRKNCSEMKSGQKNIEIDPNIKIGFLFGDDKKSTFKNKKLYWQPKGNLLGVGAEF